MAIIKNYWELKDFCYTHGRVIPHTKGNSSDFTEFHCADKKHDDSETIICSDGIGICQSTIIGILTMSGIVVEFEDKDEYLLCTESEFDLLQEQSKKEKRIREEATCSRSQIQSHDNNIEESQNPARPQGVEITKDIQDISYKSYYKCLDYPIKIMAAKAYGYLTPPYPWGDSSYTQLICKYDCIFPNCPFYDRRLFDELRHNHRTDYDEWVVKYAKECRGLI